MIHCRCPVKAYRLATSCCACLVRECCSPFWPYFLQNTSSIITLQWSIGGLVWGKFVNKPVMRSWDHLSYGITQCYLPPDRVDSHAFTPAYCRYPFIDPGRMKGWVDLGGGYTKMVYPPTDGHPSSGVARLLKVGGGRRRRRHTRRRRRRWQEWPIQVLTGPDVE